MVKSRAMLKIQHSNCVNIQPRPTKISFRCEIYVSRFPGSFFVFLITRKYRPEHLFVVIETENKLRKLTPAPLHCKVAAIHTANPSKQAPAVCAKHFKHFEYN